MQPFLDNSLKSAKLGFLSSLDLDPDASPRKNRILDIQPLEKPDPKYKKPDHRKNRTPDIGPLKKSDLRFKINERNQRKKKAGRLLSYGFKKQGPTFTYQGGGMLSGFDPISHAFLNCTSKLKFYGLGQGKFSNEVASWHLL